MARERPASYMGRKGEGGAGADLRSLRGGGGGSGPEFSKGV